MKAVAKLFGCAFILSLFLTACGGGAKQHVEDTSGVQDIEPGQQSVIQPPSSAPVPDNSRIREKDI